VPILLAPQTSMPPSRARVAAERLGRGCRSRPAARSSPHFSKALAARAVGFLPSLLHRENGKSRDEAWNRGMMALGHVQTEACAEAAMTPRRGLGRHLANFPRDISSSTSLGVIGVMGLVEIPAVHTADGRSPMPRRRRQRRGLEPSELTPLDRRQGPRSRRKTFALPDLLQVVTVLGATGAALAGRRSTRSLSPDSPGTDRKVMMAAAERLTPVLLELGGKDAMIVAEDADLAKAAEACVFGALTKRWSACISVERVYVPRRCTTSSSAEVVSRSRAQVGATMVTSVR